MGERYKGGWWKSYHGTWLYVWSLFLLQLASSSSALVLSDNFNFTRDTYNATIYEKAPGKTYVTSSHKMGITVSNPWLSVNYKIFDGDNLNVFKAEEYRVGDFYFLRVRTLTSSHGILNRELESRYHLKIKAVGKIEPGITKTATCDLIINVLDENDLHPLFDKETYDVSVGENAPVHSSIVQVSASDGDIGINAEIYYSFIKKTDYFAIHPTSGVITVTKQLNYLVQAKYDLEVEAQDRGPKTLRNGDLRKALVRITITPANFFAPHIKVKKLPFHHMKNIVGTSFAILTVTDSDIGTNGLIQSVKIVSGDKDNHFKIVKSAISDEYLLILNQSVIISDNSVSDLDLTLTVEATDTGSPSKKSSKPIKINIDLGLNGAPKFISDSYQASIEESVPIDTSVIHLSATKDKFNRNSEIIYKIVAGNDENWFSINKITGLIETNGDVDAEVSSEVILTILAKDKISHQTSTTNLTVTILDCNDNPPKFDIKETDISFEENLTIGSIVYKVHAIDPDKGDNGVVSYSIRNLQNVPFEIDHFTGEIKTSKVLDYETMKRNYPVYIAASDWGKPFKLESYITLNFHLRNINDNKPLFEKSSCSGYLSRDAPVDTSVTVITAVDFDNSIITYNIEEGNDDGCFELIPSTGLLSLNCSLSDDSTDKRTLKITASDGKFTSESVKIDITLVNNKRNSQLANSDANIVCASTNATMELSKLMQISRLNNEGISEQIIESPNLNLQNFNAPIFNSTNTHHMKVDESAAVNTLLTQIVAHDDDKGYNGLVVYVIVAGDPYDQFTLDLHNGSLFISSALDRESIAKYDLEIRITDSAPLELRKSASMNITVEIIDANDNPPIFEKEKYETEVSESIGFNATILQVFAEDKDEGENSRIQYWIMADMPEFFINPGNGIITVKKSLDRELHDVYYIPVLARDHGSPSHSATTTVTLNILDENDNIPKFVPENYDLKVREDLPVGSVITTIKAIDDDAGENGKLAYKLVHGTDEMFEIEETTGTVRIAKQLDFTTKQVYNISAFVSDGGNPPLKSACFINIEVMDVNENLQPPKFKNFFEIGYINENMPISSVVLQVKAIDPDAQPDERNPVVYSIRDGSGLGRFKIDFNGTITTAQVLDRESATHYWLSVYAQDRGLVPQHARLDVYIKVLDVNDNIPQMSQPVYYMEVKENSKQDVVVGLVQATDKDENPSEQLTFSITKGNAQKHFQIDEHTGVIRTTKTTLDRDEGDSQHLLEVTVNDNGVPNLSSTARVLVEVLDQNDNAPEFQIHSHQVRILRPKTGSKQNPVYRVYAVDKDEGLNAELSYRMQGKRASQFYVEKTSGQIYVDEIEPGSYSFRVRAYDRGDNRQKDSCKVMVEVIEGPKASASQPVFEELTYKFQIEENAEIGGFVGMIEATDADFDKLWYHVIDGDEDNQFDVKTESGTLLVAKKLDWETKNHYNLTISVTDGIHVTLTTVYINVIDINDNSPLFLSPSYETTIPENMDVGMSIMKVSAIDKDENNRLFYTITAAENEISINKFDIDSRTGVITVKEELDREVISTHELTIMVRDQGIPSNRNFTRVRVIVTDHNDHAPKFLSSTIEGRVFESAAVGTSVVEVIALDDDKGENAEIAYSIQSGNIGDMFEIDETLGLISVKRQLDKNQRAEYSLIVKASDQGRPPQSSTATVNIYITISNNAPPKFTGTNYIAEINEDIKIGSNVAVLEAKSQSSVYYEIIQGNEGDKFAINPNSGVIYVKNKIDYEQVKSYDLMVSAANIVGYSALTTVKIHVIDINDNTPEFSQQIYEGTISEAAQIASVVVTTDNKPLVIHATDLDENDNGRLKFSIIDEEAKKYFVIDTNTGAIRTAVLLDHETMDKIEFSVDVSDQGSPALKSHQPAKVIIHIEDVNDHAPVFMPKGLSAILLLPTAKDVRVTQVTATDPDTKSSQNVKYRILHDNNGGSHFNIDPLSGLITVTNTNELKTSYSLTVEASDGKFQTTSFVNITVKTSHSSGLVFSSQEYHVTIPENKEISDNLMVVQVVNFANDPLVFNLLNGNDMFTMGQTSGVLQTKQKIFDRENISNYNLVVSVEDLSDPPRKAHVVVKVNIEDENDNSPVFLNQPYDTVVAITAKVGTPVRQLTVQDRDSGDNGKVEFTMVKGYKDKFSVDQVDGQVMLMNPLEKSDEGQILLFVMASDLGSPMKSSFVNVTVTIVGSEHPVFEKRFYTTSIKEDVALFTPVISVKASSPNGHKLIYSITGGDPYKEFAVDYNIGKDVLGPCVISVVSPLDYESTKGYDLTLTAKDVKTGSVAETKLRISVVDVNDNKPVFSKFKYTSLLSESVPIGSSVAMVTATDADVGSNGLVYYSLVPAHIDSEDVSHFEIDSESGHIVTTKMLDYEEQHEFNVIAIATDGGSNKHFTTAPLHIILQDLNDNPPYFVQKSYDCTIFDQPSSSYVVKVMASDPDPCSEGNLQYSIVGGNIDQVFHVNQQTGLISLSSRRTGLLQHAYILNISVSDGVFTAFTQVSLSVKSSNNHTPMFTRQLYRSTILENLGKGMIVTMVTAFDEDPGTNGMLTYTIPSDEMKQYFSIDADTGEIFSEFDFDREKRDFYQIPIAVTDNAGRIGFSMVEVTIRDLNDNPPRFLRNEYKLVVSPGAVVNSSFAKIEAVDMDKGPGGRVRYELAKPEKLFNINPYTGDLIVKMDLKEFANQVYQFFVHAIDEGDPILDSSVAVQVYVMGKNDIAPRFQASKKMIFTISEDETVFSRLIVAESHNPVKYYIIHGNTPDTNYPPSFEISHSGKLKLLRKLDYNDVQKYHLSVQAKTTSSPSLYDYVEVIIIVTDSNNKDPVFESNEYHTMVIENSKPGDHVIQVRAMDEDSDFEIRYSFGEESSGMSKIFDLDSISGWISLINPLDRETTDQYNFTIVAMDIKAKTEQKSLTRVLVDVTDQNDNPPIFSRPSYIAAVNEGADLGTVVTELFTTDEDIGPNTNVEYIIVDGDKLGKFHVRGTGEVIVNKPLDRENDSLYTLVVAATDGGMSTMTKITIEILDDNDNDPVCDEPIHPLILSEEKSVGSIIVRVKATDADDAATVHAEISYVIRAGNEKQKFNLDKSTGILTVKSELDREEIDNYHLSINAVDGGGRSCDIDVFIDLSDINDNSPRFIDIPETFQVIESTPPDTLLMRVRAVDDDLGINRQVKYNLKDDADGSFTLDPETGVITLVSSLDREKKDLYKLMLEAYDMGNPSKTGEVLLKIAIQDENDNPPEFVRSSYIVSISEDAVVNSDVIAVTATSKDIGVNAKMLYMISAGNVDRHFNIDTDTGMIQVAKTLDHETTSEYILTIIAHDRSSAPLSSSTFVTINVTDVNDNQPEFVQNPYKLTLKEDVPINEVILHLTASDADTNSIILYSIIKGNTMDKFDVNPKDGQLLIKNALDREMVNNFELTIKASDGLLSSETVVIVDVLDVNDCPPKFSESNYSAVIQRPREGNEDRHVGYEILSFSVTDDDLPPNGEPFSYDIVSGNKGGEFMVNSNGVLTTARKFNRHVQDMYNLVVRAYDFGSPLLHSEVPVVIEIIEEGNNPPKVSDIDISVMSFKDSFPGGIIGTLNAVDEDIFDELTFEIISTNKNLFDIDKYDGRIMAFKNIDPGRYNVNISVTDGRFQSYGIVSVEVVGISDDMIKNSVTIQFHSLSVEDFFNKHLKDFKRVLKRELNVRSRDVEIINVQTSKFASSSFGKRRKRDVSPDLDVLFAIKRNQNTFIRGKPLSKKVGAAVPAIEQALQVKVIKVFGDICTHSSCKEGTCEGYIEFDSDNLTPVRMGSKSTVTARHRYLYKCVCPDGSTDDSCDKIPAVCPSDACPDSKMCKMNSDQRGYLCVCPPGMSGQHCDEEENFCADSSCRIGDKPMTFSGKSYAKWTLQDAFTIEQRLTLSLRIKTRKQLATIMYAKGKVDYSILEIYNGMLQYRFNCGSGEGIVIIPLLISDGEWHTVMVERFGKTAELILDHTYSSMTMSPGTNDILDLKSNNVFFGAEVEIYNGYSDIRRGFEGCMENIRLYNVRLPFDGSNAVALDQEFKYLQFHCKDTYQSPTGTNICSTFPCDNNGNCEVSGSSYICTCSDRFYGSRCEIDKDPCANSPCQNKGQCINKKDIPNDFECRCPSPFRGKFCEYGKYCSEDTCQNNGSCVEGPKAMVCNCLGGFEGENCQKIVSACRSNPCMNGATCHNADNTYICNCTEKSAGRNCEELITPHMISNSAGITQEELFIIIGVAGGIIVLAFLFVAIQCIRRRQNSRYGNITLGIPTDETDVMLRSLKEDNCKNGIKKSNVDITHPPPSPRPPPVPDRPASYTPSNHDSLNTLNNFDNVRNYGSAADELENIQNIPYYAEYLQTFAPLPRMVASQAPSLAPLPSSNPASDTDSIQKTPWEMDNMLEHTDKNHPEKLYIKNIPGPQVGPPDNVSFSSLPVSESEDEPAASKSGRRKKRKDYHWDASDWAPRPSLPNISEVPNRECPDSPSSSPHSNESNEHADCLQHHYNNDVYTDGEMIESEYVGDSEYADNEGDTDHYLNPPNYQEIFSQYVNNDDSGNQDMSYELPEHNFGMHPNNYLPMYNLNDESRDEYSDNDNFPDPPEEFRGGENRVCQLSEDDLDDNDEVVHYGFPSQQPLLGLQGNITDSEYNVRSSMIDSMGGYTSTNASMSDISGLCEIEDSEVNFSDESGDENNERTPLNIDRLHTQV
ncbi:protocadherin Fat 1-like isoform X4 [Mytilus edulis]|uniref:protocadherin Fat 1-like isoform X4 n=1 Tax=Mytilus edulis TaxID=6550 RepID=UPI0039EFAA35